MDAETALSAINGILEACNSKTRNIVLRELSTNYRKGSHSDTVRPQKRKPLVTLLEAKEDLIKNYFKQ